MAERRYGAAAEAGRPQAEVVAESVAAVSWAGNQADLGVVLADEGNAIVRRGVVDDPDRGVEVRQGGRQGRQARIEVFPGVVVDDDDGQVLNWLTHRAAWVRV